MATLDLALIGNGTIGALVDAQGEITWSCFPRFDGDPAFCSLLKTPQSPEDFGFFAIEVLDCVKSAQEYLANTPVLITRLFDRSGGRIEIIDFAPRFRQFGRLFCPIVLARRITRVAGTPRIRVRLRPAYDYGRRRAGVTYGSNHIRYVGDDLTLRLTTDAPVTLVLEESAFFLDDSITLLLGPDETVQGAVG